MVTQGSAWVIVPWLSLLLSTLSWWRVCAHPDNRRRAPMKWNLLTLFTIGEAISVGFLSSFYKFQSVVTAMGGTALATTAISVYTMLQRNPKYDLSQWGAGLTSYVVIVIVIVIEEVLELPCIVDRFPPISFLLCFCFVCFCLFPIHKISHERVRSIIHSNFHGHVCISILLLLSSSFYSQMWNDLFKLWYYWSLSDDWMVTPRILTLFRCLV